MIGIRREDKSEWERRVPLVPDQLAALAASGLHFSVQPSQQRAFPDEDFRKVGARVDESFADCSVVLGIKEIPAELLEADKAYVYFSHTLKAQPYNMPMLKHILDIGATLLDYELIADDSGRRLIFFGRHAGYAGMLDGLWALGRRLAHEGHASPFAELKLAWQYDSLQQALDHVSEVGAAIARDGMPAELHPFVCGFTGTGNVSLGAQEVFDRLPHQTVAPGELDELATLGADADRNVVYKTVFDLPERYRRKDGGKVAFGDLVKDPGQFENGMQRYLGQIDMLVNGMFWVPALPPLLTLDELAAGRRDGTLTRLRVIADIACDIDGAVKATVKSTTSDNPVFVYDVDQGVAVDGVAGNGPVVMAVDILPAELPRESSKDFGDTLMPFVPALDACDWSRPLAELELPPELRRAIIAHRGQLTPAYAWLEKHLP